MDDPFELTDPQDAQAFLRSFTPQMRSRGEACFQKGRVLELVPEDPGKSYSVLVRDRDTYEVDLFYEEGEGWQAGCSCQCDTACEHMFAAMSALLAEHRTASVRSLSSGTGAAIERLAEARSRQRASRQPDVSILAARLEEAQGQRLTRVQVSYLRTVHAVYLRCCQTHQITPWDFHELGFALNEFSWTELQVWPAFPEDEHEFWLFVAHAAKQKRLAIPAFMQPVSDFSSIQERLVRWKRTLEVEEWKQKLRSYQSGTPGASFRPPGETDLRLVVDVSSARLEWRRPGRNDFEALKSSHLRQLYSGTEYGTVEFAAGADLLWQVFAGFSRYSSSAELVYNREETTQMLARVLRSPVFESRVVTPGGQVLARPADPWRWVLRPAAGKQDDYRLRLVQADGSPAPSFLVVIPGAPALYLSALALYKGPESAPGLLEPLAENRIPAPAVENSEGVAFLRALGVELPPNLRERVQTLTYRASISCALRPALAGGGSEECLVEVRAEAPDGHELRLKSSGWSELHPQLPGRKQKEGGEIILHDRAALEEVQALLEPLKLRSSYLDDLSVRVTRKFPELFAEWLSSVPPHVAVHLKGELTSFSNAEVAGRVKLDVTEAEIDWFDLRVGLDVADTTLTPGEIKLLLNAQGGYVRLKGKGWKRLKFDLSEEESEHLARLGLNPRELSDEPQRLHALQLADKSAKKFLPAEQVEQIQRRASEIQARVAPQLPAGITAALRPYQLEGYHFLAYLSSNRFGGILADDMGLGKTLQALAWLLWLRDQPEAPRGASAADGTPPGPGPALVVCPKSVMDNWHAEAARFASGLRVKVWAPSELAGFAGRLSDADLHVLNYSQLRMLGESLVPVRWCAVILDEGQYIKNPSSQTAQIARSLRAGHRLVLSGTPIENRLSDLWSLMGFAMPGVLGSRAQFAKLYDAKGDPFARKRLAARVRPFVLRRTKAQVAKDLPERIEEDLFCEIEGEQQMLYRAELKRAQQLLLGIRTQKELAQQQFHFLTSLLRLRQICCHPRLVKPDSSASSAKMEALMEQVGPLMEEGQKVLVFSQFVEMLDLLQPILQEQGWPVYYLAGHTENRGDLVRQFQSTPDAAVFLISLKAGGFGLNLTAASYVILFDPWWNPAVENQAIDRTHRIGQTRNVIAYRLLIKNSIEEKIRELQKQKKALAEDVLGEEKFAQSLTLQDLEFLFAD
ncbi:MAG TPA: DEAD/DEAH box helicase [Verrucomicrobiae bacterium]|nr:DEAD/DEAH box helicase [Verrucomicrobiae bacterium]